MTVVQDEIENILNNISYFIDTEQYSKALSALPTDIFYLKSFTEYISNYKNKYCVCLQLWIFVLVQNPFEISKIITVNDMNEILHFLACNLNKHRQIDKYNVKSIAFLLSHIIDMRNTKSETMTEAKDGKNTLLSTFFEDFKHLYTITVWDRIIYEIVKIRRCFFDITFSERDNISTIRYKIKAISYQPFLKDNLNRILHFLDSENGKIGWTLSKSIVRMLKHKDQEKFVKLMEKRLFSNKAAERCEKLIINENLWINIATILAMLILKKQSNKASDNVVHKNQVIGDFLANLYTQIIETMIFYTNKTKNKSENVRQTGLFLFWVCIRCKIAVFSNNDAMQYLVMVSLTDESLICRRAASTVLFEFVGRSKVENGDAITNLINFHTVKRMEQNIKTLQQLFILCPFTKKPIIDAVIKKIRTFDVFYCGIVYAEMIMQGINCFCVYNSTGERIDEKYEYDTYSDTTEMSIYDIMSSLYLIIAKERNSECTKCYSAKIYNCIGKIIMKEWLGNKYFNLIVEAYVDSIYHIGKKGDYLVLQYDSTKLSEESKLTKNIIFLMDKNLYTERLPEIARKYITCATLYTNFTKKSNNCYILANCGNYKYYDQICNKFLSILDGCDTSKKVSVINVIKNTMCRMQNSVNEDGNESSRCMSFNITDSQIDKMLEDILKYTYTSDYVCMSYKNVHENLISKALRGLEDYSVDMKGDVGSSVRLAALRLLAQLKAKRLENYLMKFLVDKCVKLRKEALKILNKTVLSEKLRVFCEEYKKRYTDLENEHKVVNECLGIDETENENIDATSIYHDDRIMCLNEKMHFTTILSIEHMINEVYIEDFSIGLLCTFKNCDSNLFKMLRDNLVSKTRLINTALLFFERQKRHLLLSGYFLAEMYAISENQELKIAIRKAMQTKKGCKIGSRVKEIVETILQDEPAEDK